MCPRATAQHGGAAMAARVVGVAAASAHSFGEEEYIDLDLSSCGEFEFRVCRSSSAAPPCAEELLCQGRLRKVVPRTAAGAKLLEADAGAGGGGGRRSTATVAPLQQHSIAAEPSSAQPARTRAEGSRCKKPGKTVHAKLQASRAFFRSLFARTSCSESDEQCHGIGVRAGSTSSRCQMKNIGGCRGKAPIGQPKSSYGYSSSAAPTTLRRSIEQEKLMDEEEHAASSRQRKSFSGAIRWLPTTPSSRRRSSCSSGCAPPAPLKRSSSARFEPEPEGLIQGAIAYCKRSQQQRVLARKSVTDAAALCSSSLAYH